MDSVEVALEDGKLDLPAAEKSADTAEQEETE